jgi:ABC-type Fe3+ transport system substrate-binding protein
MVTTRQVCSALLLLVLAGCGPASSPAGGATSGASGASSAPAQAAAPDGPLPALVEAARREGQLNLVWSENSFGGADGARRFAEGFNKLYGINVQFRFTPGPAPNEVAGRAVQEYQSGRTASTDVLLLGGAPLSGILNADMLERVDWAAWAPNIHDPELVALGGIAVAVAGRMPGITYNTSRVTGDAIPTSLQDVLKPQYKGRIASTPYASAFDWLATPEFWGEQRTREYVTRLAEQITGLIRCGEMQRIASGEFDMLVVDCGGFEALKAQRRGQPLSSVIPSDLAAITYWYMSVPKNAPHPAAAKLLINYLLSREGQEVLWEVDAQDHHRVPGSKQLATIEQIVARGGKPVPVDLEFFERHNPQELGRFSEEMQAILQNR